MRSLILLFLAVLVTVPTVLAQDSVKVVALFNNKALLVINGQQKLMSKNETVDGVTLLSSSSRGAEIRFSDGQQQVLKLNQSISHGFRKTNNKKLTLYANNYGMFMLAGKINGQPTRFLLDTGATYIAMSQTEADKLGLAYESAPRNMIQTASEVVPVWNIKLDRVKVGDISVPNVDAVVLEGDQPNQVLLGMSFLQHVKLQRNGAAMILEKKY